jgi:hypothetical protein
VRERETRGRGPFALKRAAARRRMNKKDDSVEI